MNSGSSLGSIDRASKLEFIVQFLANLEGKDINDQELTFLATKFEAQVFGSSADAIDYENRMIKKLNKVAAARRLHMGNAQHLPQQSRNQNVVDQKTSSTEGRMMPNISAVSGVPPNGIYSSGPTPPAGQNIANNLTSQNNHLQNVNVSNPLRYHALKLQASNFKNMQNLPAPPQFRANPGASVQMPQYGRPSPQLSPEQQNRIINYSYRMNGSQSSIHSASMHNPSEQHQLIPEKKIVPNPMLTTAIAPQMVQPSKKVQDMAVSNNPMSPRKLSDLSEIERKKFFGELRKRHENVLLEFIKAANRNYDKMSASNISDPEILSKVQRWKKLAVDATNSIAYMEQCHLHNRTPSDISFEYLKNTIRTVTKIMQNLQSSAIRRKSNETQNLVAGNSPIVSDLSDQAPENASAVAGPTNYNAVPINDARFQTRPVEHQPPHGVSIMQKIESNQSSISALSSPFLQNSSAALKSNNAPPHPIQPKKSCAAETKLRTDTVLKDIKTPTASKNSNFEGAKELRNNVSFLDSLNMNNFNFATNIKPDTCQSSVPSHKVKQQLVEETKIFCQVEESSNASKSAAKSIEDHRKEFELMKEKQDQITSNKRPKLIDDTILRMTLNLTTADTENRFTAGFDLTLESDSIVGKLMADFRNVFNITGTTDCSGKLSSIEAKYRSHFYAAIYFDQSSFPLPHDVTVLAMDEAPDSDGISCDFENAMNGCRRGFAQSKYAVYREVSSHAFQVLKLFVVQCLERKMIQKKEHWVNVLTHCLSKFLEWIKSYDGLFQSHSFNSDKLLDFSPFSGVPLPPFARSLNGVAFYPYSLPHLPANMDIIIT